MYRIKVSLADVKPPIWRRLELSGETTLAELHEILVAAMGWRGAHLHAFVSQTAKYGPIDSRFPNQFDDEREVAIADVLTPRRPMFGWLYDFGDLWLHNVELEAVVDPDAGPYPRCLAGRRACPPDDCGGIAAYAEMSTAWPSPLAADPAIFDLAAAKANVAAFVGTGSQIRAPQAKDASRLRPLHELTDDEIAMLERFDIGVIRTQAMLAAFISSPGIETTSQWLPMILDRTPPDAELVSLIMRWWNVCAERLAERQFAPLIGSPDGSADPVRAMIWARHYVEALGKDERSWQDVASVDNGSLMAPIGTLLKSSVRAKDPYKSKAALAAAEQLPDIVADVYDYLRERYVPAMLEAAEPIRRAPKIGRNERCPCGSGRKYKACCGAA